MLVQEREFLEDKTRYQFFFERVRYLAQRHTTSHHHVKFFCFFFSSTIMLCCKTDSNNLVILSFTSIFYTLDQSFLSSKCYFRSNFSFFSKISFLLLRSNKIKRAKIKLSSILGTNPQKRNRQCPNWDLFPPNTLKTETWKPNKSRIKNIKLKLASFIQ